MTNFFSIFLVVINFRYFNEKKIDPPLQVEQFRQALSMVEDVIDNDRLCSYFSYMLQTELREENFFDLNKAREYIDQTRNLLKTICSELSFTTEDLPDDYSRFRGIRGTSPKHDVIIFNSDLINELNNDRKQSDSQLYREIFFIFVKLLHELSHACIIESGRHMNKKNPKRFHTPMTYCLQGEAGWALERMLFGSKIDAPGYTINDKFIIQYLVFTDGTPPGVIDQTWINSFVKDSLNEKKLKFVQQIDRVPYVYLTPALKTKLEDGKKFMIKSCRHPKPLSFDDFDEEN